MGYSPLASVLLSCIMATNTLIAYPIVARYGLQKHYATTLSVGASMLSLLVTPVVVAALVGSFSGGSGALFWLLFVVKFVAYCALLLYMIPHLTYVYCRVQPFGLFATCLGVAQLYHGYQYADSLSYSGTLRTSEALCHHVVRGGVHAVTARHARRGGCPRGLVQRWQRCLVLAALRG